MLRLRAMREVSAKEAAVYCFARGIETFNWRVWGRGRKEGSIEALTERECRGRAERRRGTRVRGVTAAGRSSNEGRLKETLTPGFVATLSTSHPATVGAITRTAAKLVFTGSGDEALCPLCRQ